MFSTLILLFLVATIINFLHKFYFQRLNDD